MKQASRQAVLLEALALALTQQHLQALVKQAVRQAVLLEVPLVAKPVLLALTQHHLQALVQQ
jgi:hypothetical protein